MAVQLAKAYVQIVPSMRGALPTIKNELGSIASSSSLGGVGKNIGARLAGGIKTTLKAGAATTGVAVGGVLGAALTKGFGRLKAFENAQQSLKGMKLSIAQVKTVMDNANASVRGTAFGLDEAATSAKGLVAAGVKPGKDLERILGLVGDAAAQAGISMGDMGVIWQQIGAKGRLQGEEALQLMERGIPIYQLIAKQTGKSVQEVMKLGQQGKITFDQFADAMEKGFAGSAKAMGNTVTGSFKNMNAALGRLGQGILEGPFHELPGLFMGITSAIDAFAPKVKTASDTVFSAMKGLGEIIGGRGFSINLSRAFGLNADQVTRSAYRMRDAINDARQHFAGFGDTVRKEFSALSGVVTLSRMLAVFERFVQFGSKIAGQIADIGTVLTPTIANFTRVGAVLAGGVLLSVDRLAPAFLELAEGVARASAPLSELMVPAASALVGAIVPLSNAVAAIVETAASLPLPILAAGAAFVSLKAGIGPLPAVIGGVGKAWATLRGQFEMLQLRSHLAQMEGMSRTAGLAKGAILNLGRSLKTAFVSNGPALALTSVVSVLTLFGQQAQQRKQDIESLEAALDEFGNATKDTAKVLYENLNRDGWIENSWITQFEEAGVSASELTRAIMEQGDAYDQVVAKVESYTQELAQSGDAAGSWATVRSNLLTGLKDETDKYREASEAVRKKTEVTSQASAEENALTRAIEGAIRAIDQQNNAYDKTRGGALALRAAQRDYNSAVKEAAGVIRDATSSEDERQAALDRVAKTVVDSAQKMADMGASQQEVNASLTSGRKKFEELAASAGMSSDKVAKLWAEIGANPGDITVKTNVETEQAWAQINNLLVGIDSKTGTITINGNAKPATTKLSQLKGVINNSDGTVTINGQKRPADMTLGAFLAEVAKSHGNVTIGGWTGPANEALAKALAAISRGQAKVTIGGRDMDARSVLNQLTSKIASTRSNVSIGADASPLRSWIARTSGQIVGTQYMRVTQLYKGGPRMSMYADGGVREAHHAQIAHAGDWRVWAEPETGGEAYIPLAASKRKRSLEILSQVASRFGVGLSSFADGGMTGSATSHSMPMVVNVSVSPQDLAGLKSVEDFVASARRWAVTRGA